MPAVLEGFLTGFPVFAQHFLVTITLLVIGVVIYIWLTPHPELRLIREGNTAAAISLGGAILGMALPLAVCMANSVNVLDILIWGSVTLVIQVIVFRLVDLILKDLPDRIHKGEMGAAILLFSIKLGVAAINAAAVTS